MILLKLIIAKYLAKIIKFIIYKTIMPILVSSLWQRGLFRVAMKMEILKKIYRPKKKTQRGELEQT